MFETNNLVRLSNSPQLNKKVLELRTLRDNARNSFFTASGLKENELTIEGAQASGASDLYLDTSNRWHKYCVDLANKIKQTVGHKDEGKLTRYVAWNALVGGGNPDYVYKECDLPGEPITRFFQEQWAANLTKDGLKGVTEEAMRSLAGSLESAKPSTTPTIVHVIPPATAASPVAAGTPMPPAKARTSTVSPVKRTPALQLLEETEQLHQRAARAFVGRYALPADQAAQLVEHLTQKRGVPLDSSDPNICAAFDGFVRERQRILESIWNTVPHAEEHAAYLRLKGNATRQPSRVDTSRGQIIKTLREWVDGLEKEVGDATQDSPQPKQPSCYQR